MIELTNVSKVFRLDKETKAGFLIKSSSEEDFYALKDISFKLEQGESLGIIGRNGCGKSTLLRLIAGILSSTAGKIKVKGKIMSFIELGVGLQDDLTGRDNIYLYASLLGIPKKTIERKLGWIIEFSGLEEFIDAKIKTYSSGMRVRLAFTIAILQDPDILLIDEILAVGDISFYKKSFNKIMSMKKRGKTIVLVSHDLHQIRQISDKVILLDEGNIIAEGIPDHVISQYLLTSTKTDKESFSKNIKEKSAFIAKLESILKEKNNKLSRSSGIRSLFTRGKLKEEILILEEEIEDDRIILQEMLDNYKSILFLELAELEEKNEIENILKHIEEIKKILYLQKNCCIDTTEEILGLLSRQSSFISGIDSYDEHISTYDEWISLLNEKLKALNSKTKVFSTLNELLTIAYYCSKLNNTDDKISRLAKISEMLNRNKQLLDKDIRDKISSDFNAILNNVEQHLISIDEKELIKRLQDQKTGMQKANTKKMARITKIEMKDAYEAGKEFKIRIHYDASEIIHKPVFGIGIFDRNDNFITGPNTNTSNYAINYINGQGSIEFVIKSLNLLEGRYYLSMSLTDPDDAPYDFWDKKVHFDVKKGPYSQRYGLIYFPHSWNLK